MTLSFFGFPICYDANNNGGSGGGSGPDNNDKGSQQGGDNGSEKKFTQEDVNRFLAEDRRRHQAQLQKLEQQYKKALEDQNLSEAQRKELQDALESFQAQFRTKEENLKHELEKLKAESEKQVKMLNEERDLWRSRYESAEIRRAIYDAAVAANAFRPEHIFAILAPMTKMTPILDANGKPTNEIAPRVHFTEVDPKTKETTTVVITAQEAIEKMRQRADEYGYLFRSAAAGGTGAGGTGANMPGKGKVDVRQLTPAQYRELRKSNPAALGLK